MSTPAILNGENIKIVPLQFRGTQMPNLTPWLLTLSLFVQQTLSYLVMMIPYLCVKSFSKKKSHIRFSVTPWSIFRIWGVCPYIPNITPPNHPLKGADIRQFWWEMGGKVAHDYPTGSRPFRSKTKAVIGGGLGGFVFWVQFWLKIWLIIYKKIVQGAQNWPKNVYLCWGRRGLECGRVSQQFGDSDNNKKHQRLIH